MNTRKTIRISMIALLVVALSVSMAAANPGHIKVLESDPGPIQLIPGQYVTTTAHFYDMYCDGAGVPRTFTVTPEPGYNPGELTFKISDPGQHGGVSGTVDATQDSISYTYYPTVGYPKAYDITVEIMAAADTEGTLYHIVYEDVQSGGSTSDLATATVHTTAIPEFATIAIPAIALLGLVFFMRRKKD